MSNLGEKLHNVIVLLRGGSHVAQQDVEEVAKAVTDHITELILPAIEKHLQEVLPGLAQKAVADGLEFEREEAKKIAQRLEAAYSQLAKDHGPEVAQAVASAAATGSLDPQAPTETAQEHPAEETAA